MIGQIITINTREASMSEVQSNPSTPLTQALAPLSFQETLDDLAQSPRGDHRAMAAVLTIEQDCAELDREASADPPFPQPAIVTSVYGVDGWSDEFEPPLSASEHEDSVSPASTPSEHALGAQRLGERIIRRLKKGKATNLARKPVRPIKPSRSRPLKPVRAARARAVHSHAAHGGARKAGDGGGDPPRPWWHELAEDAYGRPIVDGLVIRDGRWSPPHLQMTDHNLPGYGGGRPLYPGEPCHCDACRAPRPTTARREPSDAKVGAHLVASKAEIFIAAIRDAMAMIDELETDGLDPSTFGPMQKFACVTSVKPWSLVIKWNAAKPLISPISGVDHTGRALVAMTWQNKDGEYLVTYRHETRIRALIWYTAGERRHFTEAVRAHPKSAPSSVRAAHAAFAKAMAQARAWDRAAMSRGDNG
jgi:hypothetical protein